MFESLFAILILIADIYAVLQIVKSNASTGLKALWIVVILLLPLLGLVIWYFAGPKP